MAAIQRAELEVLRVEDDSAQRRLRVAYELALPAGDDLEGVEVAEEIVVHGISLADGLSRANSHPITIHHDTFVAARGGTARRFEKLVHRNDLDVEQDWWRAGQGGETEEIAEWIDHLVADIRLEHSGRIVDQVTTAVVSGSWGVLGED